MSDVALSREAVGPGRLVLVVGPSGAGKDTLIDLARSMLHANDGIVFARRVVTRPASQAENNIEMSPEAFIAARDAGAFALWWEAHGMHYALPITVDGDIRNGRCVVANASRTVIDAARAAYADCVVVEITAPADVLAQRLAARGRASDGTIAERLRRSVSAHRVDRTIENVGDPSGHAYRLAKIIAY